MLSVAVLSESTQEVLPDFPKFQTLLARGECLRAAEYAWNLSDDDLSFDERWGMIMDAWSHARRLKQDIVAWKIGELVDDRWLRYYSGWSPRLTSDEMAAFLARYLG
jgi:hypothetical protein